MREIESGIISQAVKKLAMDAACQLEPDILESLVAARDRETSNLAKSGLEVLLLNADIASRERIPVCQDTGVAVVFVWLGQEVHVAGDLSAAIQEGVRAGYDEGFLRKSVCDPLTRQNTGTNTPAVVHLEMVPGDHLRIVLLPKGCGNQFGRYVRWAWKAALLAKLALLRPLGEPHVRADVAMLEQDILARINATGQGVQGWGGNNTALAVHLEIFPTHIASLPVAVNIQCHAHRRKEIVL